MSGEKRSVYNLFYALAGILALSFAYFTYIEDHAVAGWMLTGFFVSLAIAFRGNNLLKGFSYTVSIIAAVCMALYNPQYFITVGDFKLSKLTIPLLQIIMFGMGTELSWKDFAEVFKSPKTVIAGLVCQFSIMPFLGFAIAKTLQPVLFLSDVHQVD
jgi:BASS family bile acid:Na+ symporter